VIKSLEDFRPKGVAGVTTLSNGQIVLILDMKELLESAGERRSVSRSTLFEAATEPPPRLALDPAGERGGPTQAVSSSSPAKACSNCARPSCCRRSPTATRSMPAAASAVKWAAACSTSCSSVEATRP
jgi:hypothetical protein